MISLAVHVYCNLVKPGTRFTSYCSDGFPLQNKEYPSGDGNFGDSVALTTL